MGADEVLIAEAEAWLAKRVEAVTASLLDIVAGMPKELAQSLAEALVAQLSARGFIVEEAGD